MGAACSICMGTTDEAKAKSEADISGGIVKDRGCTDIFCCVIFVVHILAWIVVTCMSFSDGNPAKLYMPRDFQGAYCDVKENWNNGPNLEGKTKLTFTMNVTSTTDLIAKQMMCSSAASDFLTSSQSGMTAYEMQEYLCECCLSPCAKCDGSLEVGGDLSLGNLQSTISSKMSELTDPSNAASLFSPAGANGNAFTDMWNEATKYFNQVCLPDCNTDYTSISNTSSSARTFIYTPSADNEVLLNAWSKLTGDNAPSVIRDTVQNAFNFTALPFSICPYAPRYCVPFPGVKFEEISSGYCTFEMAAEVIGAVGDSVASAWSTLGGDSFSSSAVETFGMWVGDFTASIDAFFLTAVASFVIGLVFLVLLRFFVKPCVWLAILFVFVFLAIGGGLIWVRSFQCEGTGLFDTSKQTAVAVTVTASTAASNTLTGTQAVSEDLTSGEPLLGSDYRGVQQYTVNGKYCETWGTLTGATPTRLANDYTEVDYPGSGLYKAGTTQYHNYCRNPFNESEINKGKTIWCFTTDTTKKWEECRPIGVIKPECDQGYAVPDETARKALEIGAYIIWGLAAIWLIIVVCFVQRIRLAIALNQVAATFVSHTPLILTIPMVQISVAIAWQLLWAFCASFIITQVPDDYMPTGLYDWHDAGGLTNTASKCLGKWPEGGVWKDEDNCVIGVNSTQCYRCSPPRYIVGDGRFAFSFFSYLWNNAFFIAVGQCCVAGAVAGWFFTKNADKGKTPVIRTSLWNCFRYHTGSLAMGAFILAVVQFIRYLMKYFEKQAAAQKNQIMVIVLKVAQCCIWCFEQCIKFLNKNAYIQVAMRGTNFCTSARKAFQIILANLIRFGIVAVLGSAIQSIGYIFIMLGTTVSGYFILKAMHPDLNAFIPIIMYILMSYCVGMLYMNVFGMAVDTSLQCVIFAEEKGIDKETCPKDLTSVLATSKKVSDEIEQ
mmetsp:Transcript_36352/g.77383  ORF Transcript_36352/g.77383 Transcript_36352/m.77383 type:complete len:944 (-) Transcript_36352:135-2966(-)